MTIQFLKFFFHLIVMHLKSSNILKYFSQLKKKYFFGVRQIMRFSIHYQISGSWTNQDNVYYLYVYTSIQTYIL